MLMVQVLPYTLGVTRQSNRRLDSSSKEQSRTVNVPHGIKNYLNRRTSKRQTLRGVVVTQSISKWILRRLVVPTYVVALLYRE
jgi:hypothetical protein